MLVAFPARHGRASASSVAKRRERASSCAKTSGVTPEAAATPVLQMWTHHSDGILSRRHHLLTASAPGDGPTAAMSSDMALRVDQSSMMERKVGAVMPTFIGHPGLNCKANVSHDYGAGLAESSIVAERLTETEEKLAFIRRTRMAREARFPNQAPILTILGITQGSYKHYEKRTPLPHRFIPKFCAACGVTMEWLLTGEGKGPEVADIPRSVPKRTSAPRRAKAA